MMNIWTRIFDVHCPWWHEYTFSNSQVFGKKNSLTRGPKWTYKAYQVQLISPSPHTCWRCVSNGHSAVLKVSKYFTKDHFGLVCYWQYQFSLEVKLVNAVHEVLPLHFYRRSSSGDLGDYGWSILYRGLLYTQWCSHETFNWIYFYGNLDEMMA